MLKPVSVLVVSASLLAGCAAVGESRLNPFNWFGGGGTAPRQAASSDSEVNPLIPVRRSSVFRDQEEAPYPGSPVLDVTQLALERRPGGAVLRTTGVTRSGGAFDVRLVPVENPGSNTLILEFRAIQPLGQPAGNARARTVATALWLTDQELSGISGIEVRGATNSRSIRR